ncbi:MAG: V-type ATP synthase subunit C [Methanospirillum sp.]|nr:V-type ATP synthase subunit C [Methanospirillum sp.]
MAEVMAGPAPYVYVATRLRVRKAKLLRPEEYLRMLNMSLPEITRYIEELEYKTEIDELSPSFSGVDLLEVALSWNLAKEYQNVLALAPGTMHAFTAAYLRRWDIANILTVLRGRTQGFGAGKIKEVLIPAGSLDRAALDRLVTEDSPERIVEGLRGSHLYPVVTRELSAALESGSFARLENELYKQYYADLVRVARSGIKGGYEFLQYIQLEIDITNLQNLWRLREGGATEEVREFMISDGRIPVDELDRVARLDSVDEIVDSLKKRANLEPLREAIEELRCGCPVRQVESRLTRFKLDLMDRMSRRYPFSVSPVLVYLERKRYEVYNLRAIARGKSANLAPERIQEYLVI